MRRLDRRKERGGVKKLLCKPCAVALADRGKTVKPAAMRFLPVAQRERVPECITQIVLPFSRFLVLASFCFLVIHPRLAHVRTGARP